MSRSLPPIMVVVAMALGACSGPPTATQPPPTVRASEAAASSTPTSTSTPTPSDTPTSAEPSVASPTTEPEPEPEPLAWAKLEADGPAAREDHTWTVNAEGTIAYLFGGRDGATLFDDTWAFDLRDDAWTQLAPAASPKARFGHEAVWVEDIGLVVFSGQAGPSFFNDLWAYDPAAEAWTELPAEGDLPAPRYGSCAGIGPDGRLWISHGFTQDGTRFSDTRAYDFTASTWTDETPVEGPRPVERCLHGCWWTESGELALYAGQTTGVTSLDDRWVLADGVWSRVEGVLPPARNLYARARVAATTLVFGGQAVDGSFQDDLWVLTDDAVDAEALQPAGDLPPGRAGAELIVDTMGGRAILFGGRTADGALNDIWILSGV